MVRSRRWQTFAFGAGPGLLAEGRRLGGGGAFEGGTGQVHRAAPQGAGGDPSLAGVLVMITGVIGSIIVTPLMNATGVKDMRARGFAVGVVAHGIGTARAFQVDMMAGTFAGIGMGLNAMLTPILVPVFLPWLLG